MKRKLGLLPTPNANVMRSSRGAMVENKQWSAPGLEQIAELVSGELPREFESADEIPGRSRRLLPTPAARDHKGPNPNKRDGGPDLPMAASKLLPTPRASTGGTDFAREGREGSGGDDLGTEMVKMALLPTPSSEESDPTDDLIDEMRDAGINPDERLYLPGRKWHSQRTLSRVVPSLLPTPQASDGTGGRQEIAASRNNWKRPSGAKASKPLGTAVRLSSGESTEPLSSGGKSSSGGLRLSPSFVEWLMGAPHGWTDPACPLSATEFSSRQDGYAGDES